MTTMQKIVASALIAALAGIGIGYEIATRESGPTSSDATVTNPSAASTSATTRQALYWYDPMYPQQHFDRPGKSPFMDMQLVPKYADSPATAAGTAIDPRIAKNLAVRYATAEKTAFATTVEAPAAVVFNERDVAIVQARSAGYVERVYARAPGDVIASGSPLVDLLVPEWSALQIEFQAIRTQGDVGLIAAVRQRMHLAGMPESLIAEIETTGKSRLVVTIHSPLAGVIQELGVRAGMNVAAGATLARINGLTPIWVEAAVPVSQAGSVKIGQTAQASIEGTSPPARTGTVTAVLPEINRESRTLRVRVELPNPGGALRPGMFGTVQLKAASSEALTVPAEAVIRTAQGERVIATDAQGRLRPVSVTLGAENAGRVIIASGLSEGDRVVASGQFLIDSEANLSGALARLDESMPATANATSARLHTGRGRVRELAAGKITLVHGPVATLNWPTMTMTFGLASAAIAAGVAVGDTVDFTFTQRDGEYTVQQLKKVQP